MKTCLPFVFALLLCVCLALESVAQEFLPAIETFSGKKDCYLVTTKGDTVKFLLDDLDRKKGLIVNVEGKTAEGKKFEYKAEEIQFLALAPSDYAKFAAFNEGMSSVARAGKTDFKQISRELVLFYQEYLEDKKRTVLVQLVNPGFDSQVRVYDDPYAAQTAGIGVAGMQMTGGNDKSYYVKYNGKTTRVFKKDYDKKFKEYFGSCPAVKAKYKNEAWRDFAQHLYFYEQNCLAK